MATNSQITSAISSATDLNLTNAQMVLILDRAIAEYFVDRKAVVSYTLGGKTVQTSITQAIEARKYFQDQARNDTGAVVGRPGEFVSDTTLNGL